MPQPERPSTTTPDEPRTKEERAVIKAALDRLLLELNEVTDQLAAGWVNVEAIDDLAVRMADVAYAVKYPQPD